MNVNIGFYWTVAILGISLLGMPHVAIALLILVWVFKVLGS